MATTPRITTWPDHGLVRREVYPWNTFEPNRLASIPHLNAQMARVAPKLEVRAVELPALGAASDPDHDVSIQLGVFAKEDIAPGEVILEETSLLTANNRLNDALCDACSATLPDLGDSATTTTTMACADCETIFCSAQCHDPATKLYHPAICDTDITTIAKDVHAAEAADALYTQLLVRALALAQTQNTHPLLLSEVHAIWGDLQPLQHTHVLSPSPSRTTSASPSTFSTPCPSTPSRTTATTTPGSSIHCTPNSDRRRRRASPRHHQRTTRTRRHGPEVSAVHPHVVSGESLVRSECELEMGREDAVVGTGDEACVGEECRAGTTTTTLQGGYCKR